MKKKLFKSYLNTTRLISECFKSLTSKSTTKLGSGAQTICLGFLFASTKTSFTTTQSSSSPRVWGKFTNSVMVSLSRNDRRGRSPSLKNTQLFLPGSSQTRHERQLCFTFKERITPIAMPCYNILVTACPSARGNLIVAILASKKIWGTY